jgi:EAL domain-containing protein (putative c-di-GMP-specific phosphodiesterase class I)
MVPCHSRVSSSVSPSTQISAHIVPSAIRDIPILATKNFTPVSFNVPARDFEDDILARSLLDALRISGVPPAALVVEIMENEALSCNRSIRKILLLLHKARLSLSMDDYGLGYSSVDTLSKWPLSSIKVDQGLVGRMLGSEKNARIVRSAIRLGHELRIDAIAEGVETPEQFQFLLDSGCRVVRAI